MQMTAYITYCDSGVDQVMDPDVDDESSNLHLFVGLLPLEIVQSLRGH